MQLLRPELPNASHDTGSKQKKFIGVFALHTAPTHLVNIMLSLFCFCLLLLKLFYDWQKKR